MPAENGKTLRDYSASKTNPEGNPLMVSRLELAPLQVQPMAARAGPNQSPRSSNASTSTTSQITCQFGSVYKNDDEEWFISGGNVYCGDKNFFIQDKPISVAEDRELLVFIKVTSIKPNTDDDKEIILPGVLTAAAKPEWGAKVFTGDESYDSNTNFEGPNSLGTIIVPVGKLRVLDRVATIAAQCGSIFITQCGGVLTHSR